MSGTMDPEQETVRMSREERRDTLDRALQQYGARGWRVETRSEYQATIARGKEISHVLHLLLTIFTLGIWFIVWALIGVFGGNKRRMITVDEFGNVVDQKL